MVAGLEALKDAGIVSGEGEEGWMLPGHMRDTTGVMYASSFPALDAAIGEVHLYSSMTAIYTDLTCQYGMRGVVVVMYPFNNLEAVVLQYCL